jgi:hypothetical protein
VVFVPEEQITIEGEAPAPKIPIAVKTEPDNVATVVAKMPDPLTLELSLQNLKVLDFNLQEFLKERGMSQTQIATYIQNVNMNASRFTLNVNPSEPETVLLFRVPKQWNVKRVLVNGKEPTYYIEEYGEEVKVWVWDKNEGVVFTPILASSPATVTLELQPTMQTAINQIVQGIAAFAALSYLLVPTMKEFIKKKTV